MSVSMPLHRFAIATACALSLGLGTAFLAAGDSHAAAAPKKEPERTALSKECSAKADAQKLHGKERRAFRSKCKRDGAKPAT